jgi:hypothetical protein
MFKKLFKYFYTKNNAIKNTKTCINFRKFIEKIILPHKIMTLVANFL